MEKIHRIESILMFIFVIVASISSNTAYVALTENITNAQLDDESGSKFFNTKNNSNSMPELIEYYDVDDVAGSPAPDAIYPDPDSTLFNAKKKENRKFDNLDAVYGGGDDIAVNGGSGTSISSSNSGSDNGNSETTKFSELQELGESSDLTNLIVNNKDDKSGTAQRALALPTAIAKQDSGDRMKSIDFNSMHQHTFHTMEELKNEDLRDHDLIDNIMYIYYGSNVALRKSLGGSIIIVGTVFALAAQILAVIFTMLRNRQIRRVNHLATISLNLLLTLCASNLVFIVGVQTSKNIFKCEMIAVLLHYFHLSTAVWGLCHTFSIYDYVINENVPVIKYNNLVGYGASAVFVLFSFAISSSSYEIYDYCWMSVQRGMIINFMIPTSILIVVTTIFGTMTLRSVVSKQRQVIVESIENILDKCQHIDATTNSVNLLAPNSASLNTEYIPTVKCCDEMDKVCENDLKPVDFYDSKFDLGALSIADLSLQSSSDSQDFAEFKRAIKFSLFFQPAFSVCWFLGVVALENRQSCIMPVTFIACYNILNWYILYRFPNISPLIIPPQAHNETNPKHVKKMSQFDSNYSISDEVNQTPSCTDTIPLLCSVTGANNVAPNCNGTSVGLTPAGSTGTLQSTNACLSKQLSLEDIIYKTSMSQWDASMENINLDCISTISN